MSSLAKSSLDPQHNKFGKIWKLSPSLATPRNDEESQLELFFKQFTDESDESAPPGGRKKKKKKKTKPAPSSSTDGGDDSKK